MSGLAGFDGITGLSGLQGNDGANGLNGLKGIKGLKGQQGAAGETGDNGDAGVGTDGLKGIKGISGVKGQAGTVGATGADGNTPDCVDQTIASQYKAAVSTWQSTFGEYQDQVTTTCAETSSATIAIEARIASIHQYIENEVAYFEKTESSLLTAFEQQMNATVQYFDQETAIRNSSVYNALNVQSSRLVFCISNLFVFDQTFL